MKTKQQHIYVASETLSDGSVVWAAVIGDLRLDCISENDAYELANKIEAAIEAHTIE